VASINKIIIINAEETFTHDVIPDLLSSSSENQYETGQVKDYETGEVQWYQRSIPTIDQV
jgi:hypothetical protein